MPTGFLTQRVFLPAAFSMLLLATACPAGQGGGSRSGGGTQAYVATALQTPSVAAGKVLTRLSPEESGLDFINTLKDPRAILDSVASQSGAAAGDYDNDGDIDFFIAGMEVPSRLYRNEGGMKFTDVTAASGSGLGCDGQSICGAAFADFDGDKDLDLYACNRSGTNRLFINDGKGVFSEEGAARGAASAYSTVMAGVFDADNDGDLDMYLCNYAKGRLPDNVQEEGRLDFSAQYNPETGKSVLPPDIAKNYYLDASGKLRNLPDPDELLINDGSGHFANKIAGSGLEMEHNGWDLQALPADFNNDGLTDLMVCNDFEIGDGYYLNRGNLKFENLAADHLRVTSFFSMGSDVGDLNGDGRLDMCVVDMSPSGYKDGKKQSGDMHTYRYDLTHYVPQQQMRNAAYLNRGDGWMSECAEMLGVKSTEWSWTARIADLNCDGLQDFYVSNGFINRLAEMDVSREITKMANSGVPIEEQAAYLTKLGPLATDDVIFTASAPMKFDKAPDNWGMKDGAVSCGVLLEDFDGDGDVDFMSNNTDSPSVLWRNDVADGKRLVLRLRSSGPNTRGINARVTARIGESTYTNEVILSRGWATGSSGDLCIGLGNLDQLDEVSIRWPDHTLQSLSSLAAGQLYTITEPAKLPKWEPAAAPAPLFAQKAFDWKQIEKPTGDNLEFKVEQLLPAQRSQLGTGCAVTDLDGDGALDCYFCGASGQTGALFRGDGKGGFTAQALAAGLIPAEVEEMSALVCDPNADGRPDLLVAAGGNENPLESGAYLPRVIANKDGSPASLEAFTPGGLIGWSAGSCAQADLDQDGTPELLVCGRQWPFAYMKPSFTRIYRQDDKSNYTDITAQLNDKLERIGVVADGQFADLNGDGKQDLVLALEMGPVAVFYNQDGKLVRGADAADNGMWQSLGLGDFDNDGDIDILAGNLGWNTKYHPKDGKPMTVVCDDFDHNGIRDLIEVKWRDDGCALPGRGRSCSGYAIDYIPKKFPTWTSFADATFEDVYGKIDTAAERYDSRVLRSQVLLNDGTGRFAGTDLPVDVQLSIAQGIGVGDFDNDGKLDAYVAQNFHWPQPETGRWIAGYGVLLHGKGDGSFEALDMAHSGINFHEDGRGVVPCDVNGDGCLDLIFSASDASPQLCLFDPAQAQGSGLEVTLKGKSANSFAAGAKLTLELSDGTKLTRIVQSGSGLLSSYSGPVHFGVPKGSTASKLTVLWPDGSTKESSELSSTNIEIMQD